MKKQSGSRQVHMSKEEVMQAIRERAEKLGRTPQLAELARMGVLERMHVRRHFRSYTLALRECGLEPQVNAAMTPMKTLFAEWARVARRMKRLPVIGDFPPAGKISRSMFIYRFGGWRKVAEAMAQYAREQKLEEKWQDVMELIARRRDEEMALRAVTKPKKLKRALRRYLSPVFSSPVYGRALVNGPLVNEPINEQGVLFLFGALAEKLGFRVTLVQTGFPDVEALIEVSPGRWRRVRIEIEYESRNFVKHRHHVKGCDMIVCWVHNWKECPLEVIELSKFIG